MNVQVNTEFEELVLSRDEVRAIDQAAIESLEMPGLLLMENAARGLADQLRRVCRKGDVTILCGPGNNGGDGLAAARLLAAEGWSARVILETAGRTLTADAQHNLMFLTNSGVTVEMCDGASLCHEVCEQLTPDDWVVESLLGTGVRGDLRSPFIEWVQAVNASKANVLAVDVPTGLDCDTGTTGNECVRADLTVTFVGRKQGFLNPVSTEFTGEVAVAHIGIPLDWVHRWVQQQRTATSSDHES